MKIICTQENLNTGLSIVNHIASRNANLPILNNVLLKAVDGIITLATTNLEIGINVQIRGKVEKDGSYTVPARLLTDYINLLPKENITLTVSDEGLKIDSKKSQTEIKGMSAEDYPLIPEVSSEEQVIIKKENLQELLSQTLFAVSVDESRPEISGVFFNFSENNLVVAATDSYRLAEKKIETKSELHKKIIVPLKTLQELFRGLGVSGQGEVSISMNDDQILFSYDNVKLVSRLIDGNYPDYEQIIPKEEKTIVTTKITELVKAIKGAALFCKPGINDVKMTFLPSKGEIIIVSANGGLGENITKINADIKGDEIDMVFNYRYLLDGLNGLQSESVTIKLSNQGAPGVFVPTDREGYLYIVMPIRQ
ncbi:MAG: DNA polymerase III subunit beta [Candidatus Komeilibacteria bacterium]